MNSLTELAAKLGIPLFQLQIAAGEESLVGAEISTLQEALQAYHRYYEYDSDTKAIVLYRWEKLVDDALTQARNIDEVRWIFAHTPQHGRSREKVALRLLVLANTIEEIRDVSSKVCGIRVNHAVHEKWKELSTAAIWSADNLEEALIAFKSTPGVHRIQIAALERCLQFVFTSAEAKLVCSETNATSECRELALRHWLKIASTSDELHEVYTYCFNYTEIRKETLQKILRLHELVPA